MKTAKWRLLIRDLRKAFPVGCPVVVRRAPRARGSFGATVFTGEIFRIYISSSAPAQVQEEALIHEWAHIRAIDEAYGHSGAFATKYGEIYEAWEGNFE